MASQNSKLWPVNPFLSHSVAASLSTSRLSKCRSWLSARLTGNRSNQNQNCNSRHSSVSRHNNKGNCKEREFVSKVSDVFCITGGITAITGTLVASFGIFPRNQASIRLYLEFIGCSMVIVGVLILFASLKLKPTSKVMAAPDDMVFFATPANGVNISSNFIDHRLNRQSPVPAIESINLRAPAPVVQRQVTVCSEIQRMVEHESSRCDSDDGSSLNSGSWIPQDAYGEDHQAAIEAALSTVLAVSTLVGFRAHQTSSEDQNSSQYCCLHHTIQHTIKARKWIKKLRLTTRGCNRQCSPGAGRDPLMLLQRGADSATDNPAKEKPNNINETEVQDIKEEVETSFSG